MKIRHTLRDGVPDATGALPVNVTIAGHQVYIDADDGVGTPIVLLDLFDGELSVFVYADPESDEYTHKISLPFPFTDRSTLNQDEIE